MHAHMHVHVLVCGYVCVSQMHFVPALTELVDLPSREVFFIWGCKRIRHDLSTKQLQQHDLRPNEQYIPKLNDRIN